ncbi:glutathione S-transferase [Roseovarius nanhaiticus]|uniref:Glutathione S-transferase n=1 Tax=Roseovarius nanhaiticus TaxID=573024 RepID=A0A1N7H7S9_9RHOB|nr:glutathione S-transferase N-terminal domain-containing protein [Roseovarius nanhaiticus]SEL09696.1 glutathione S-transferase [Roseovarius nanhaiticus]SIS20934.1 glutathione S-transferase [Roseovarius nanhaiticus]
MKLMKSTTSPYARLAHAMLIEAGADFELDILNPWADPDQLVAANPARRVPTLIMDDGTVMTEAMLIADHAAKIAPEGSHLKSISPVQYEIAGRAWGVTEAAVHIIIGRKIISDDLAATEYDSHPVAQRRYASMTNGLTQLEPMADHLSDTHMGMAEISVANAIEYVDFRFPEADWRPAIPALDAWRARNAHRPSLRDTVPS